MPPVENGIIRSLSVSRAESFDHNQKGGCALKWWFSDVKGLRPKQTDAQNDGELGHALLATYFRTGKEPEGRVKMGKAVTGAIVKGELPKPGPDLMVESRFDGQPARDADGKWIPVDTSKTLWVAGVPWDGFVDLRFRRSDVVEVWDHKFGSDIHAHALPSAALVKTIQLPIYCLDSLRVWPDARTFRLVHHNVSKKGVDSFVRDAVVSLDQVREREADVERVVDEMKRIALVENQTDVPFNKKACEVYGGCPHQSICSRYKEKTKVSLTPEELALFGEPIPDSNASTPAAPAVSAVTTDATGLVPSSTPTNDPGLPPPDRKRGRKPKIVEVKDGETEAEAETRAKAGEEMIACSVCGTDIGLRPKGHKIDPMFCPNKANHPAPTVSELVTIANEAIAERKTVADVIATVTVVDPYKRLARALRAFADALEQP